MADPYGIDPAPRTPDLPGVPIVHDTDEEILDALAAEVYVQSLACVRSFGDYHLALSAGPFQERLCRRLMIDPNVRALPWSRTHVWALSDRPDGRGRGCFGAIVDLLVDQAGIPEANLHAPMHGHAAADEYQGRLQQALAWREKGQDRLDMAVLVVEPDGAMAGVGPAGVDDEDGRLVAAVGPGLAMTCRLVNATRLISVVAVGAEAGAHVRRLESDPAAPFPSPIGGMLRWYLDREACAD